MTSLAVRIVAVAGLAALAASGCAAPAARAVSGFASPAARAVPSFAGSALGGAQESAPERAEDPAPPGGSWRGYVGRVDAALRAEPARAAELAGVLVEVLARLDALDKRTEDARLAHAQATRLLARTDPAALPAGLDVGGALRSSVAYGAPEHAEALGYAYLNLAEHLRAARRLAETEAVLAEATERCAGATARRIELELAYAEILRERGAAAAAWEHLELARRVLFGDGAGLPGIRRDWAWFERYEAMVCALRGETLLLLGNPDQAAPDVARQLALARAGDSRVARRRAWRTAIDLAIATGRTARVERLVTEALDDLDLAADEPGYAARLALRLGAARALAGRRDPARLDAAAEALERALAAPEAEPFDRLRAGLFLADVRLREGRLDAAAELVAATRARAAEIATSAGRGGVEGAGGTVEVELLRVALEGRLAALRAAARADAASESAAGAPDRDAASEGAAGAPQRDAASESAAGAPDRDAASEGADGAPDRDAASESADGAPDRDAASESAELAPALAALELAYEAWLARQDATPVLPSGVGFLHHPARRLVLSELLHLTALVHPGEAGAARALEQLARAQARGSLARRAGVAPPDLAAIRAALTGRDRGLLVWLPGPDRTDLFALDAERIVHATLAGWPELEPGCAHLGALVAAPPGEAARARGARVLADDARVVELARALLPPEARELLARWTAVTVVGAELLADVPVGELPLGVDADGGPRLGDRLALAYLPSLPLGVWLAERAPRAAAGTELLLVVASRASAEAERLAGSPLPELAFGAEQRARLAEAYAATTLALGVEATRAALSADARVLHVLAHGIADGAGARGPGLALAPEAAPAEAPAEAPAGTPTGTSAEAPTEAPGAGDGGSGVLWVGDAFALDLPEHVVLTACGAGGGALRRGEDGGASFAGALLWAGARSALLSPHALDYAATLVLCGAYHRHLRAGASPAEALRRARVELPARWRHPFFTSLRAVGLAHEPVFAPR